MSMQVTKVWWDGEKLMAEPISAAEVYKPEPVTEWLTCPKCNHMSPYSPIKAKTLAEDAERITKQARAALAEREALKTCCCRWDGDVLVQQCTLHEAHVDAIHEWAERAKSAEAKLKAQHESACYKHGDEPKHGCAWCDKQPAQHAPVGTYYGSNDFGHEVVDLDKAIPIGTKLYTRPQAREPLTDAMVVAAARMLSDRQAAACNVDCGDMWKLHGNDFIDDARAALEAAHGIKGGQHG
jgi:hypothetical protein